MKKPSPMLAIFLTVFIDMLSFGMAIPDIQLRGEKLGAVGFSMGMLLSIYSITQFFSAPLIGRWSDSKGRRPVLIITTIFTILCFLVYSQAKDLQTMYISRILAGLSAGNLSVAFAYVAEITEPEERSSGMGILGAAFGLGFIFGPVMGAWLIAKGGGGPQLLGFVAAGFAVINLIFLIFFLPEPAGVRTKSASGIRETFGLLGKALKTPALGFVVMLFFVANFAFSLLESTFFLLLKNQYGMDQMGGAQVLFVVGVTAAVTQGYLIRFLSKRFGELTLIRVGYLLQAPALASVPFTPPMVPLMIGAGMIGFASGITGPSVNSLMSRAAPPDMKGGVSGIVQSAGALARIFGPTSGAFMFKNSPSQPYIVGGIVMLIAAILAFLFKPPASEGEAEAKNELTGIH